MRAPDETSEAKRVESTEHVAVDPTNPSSTLKSMDPQAAFNLAAQFSANAVKRQGLFPLAQAQEKIAAGVQPALDQAMAASGAACKPGCNWCCHRPIALTILEAASIVDHIIEIWPDDRQRSLNERLRSYESETRMMRANPLETMRVQCPFLEDSMCSIYEHRPWMCRAQASTDVEACKNWKENPYERVPFDEPGIIGPPGKFAALRITRRPRIDSCDALGEATLDGILGGAQSAGVQLGLLELGLAIRPQLAKSPALKDIPYDSDTRIAVWVEGFHPRIGEPSGMESPSPQVLEVIELGRVSSAKEKALPVSGMDARLAVAHLQMQIAPDSEDEITESRAHYEAVLDRLLDIELDSVAAFEALDAHTNVSLPYFGFVDRDINAKFGAFATRHSGRALPDLAEPIPKNNPNGKLKVGFLSGTMYSHNASRWALGYLLHAPPDVETFALQLGPEDDFATEMWRSRSSHYFRLRGSVPESARFIKSLGLDVLVYPDALEFNYTKQFATFKLAPIQIAMWGVPYTTGFPNITHFLSSDAMEPENSQEHYTEQLVRLPRTGLCYERWLAAPSVEFDKHLLGEGPRILIAQNPSKLLPRTDALFKRITDEIRRPLLAVFVDNQAGQRLKRRWERVGIPVQWLPTMIPMEFAGLMASVDATLDTPNWSGGITTLQALSVGTPVISLPGIHLRGRLTLGFYKVIGAEHLMATDEDDYVAKVKNAAEMREEIKKLPVDDLFDDAATAASFFEILAALEAQS